MFPYTKHMDFRDSIVLPEVSDLAMMNWSHWRWSSNNQLITLNGFDTYVIFKENLLVFCPLLLLY